MKHAMLIALMLTLLTVVVAACGSGGEGGPADTQTTGDTTAPPDTVGGDTASDIAAPDDVADTAGSDVPLGDVATDDAGPETDVPPALPPLPTQAPLAAPADPLQGIEVESCALYQEERCVEGTRQVCAVYDTAESAFVEPDALLRRVLLFDRWRDLYNSPDGQAIDRDFNREVLPGTPEADWGDPAAFSGYWGTGDGGIWTGWATVAAILRYAQTGTEADYQRMEQQVRDLVTMYDVTGIPGYLCRYHFLLLPEGAPNTDQHILRWENSFQGDHHDRLVVDPENVPNLPAIYTEGIADDEGQVWTGTPMWHGRPSIDQNTGPMTALPMAYDLLHDEELKASIAHHLTCYLKRLQRIELVNLQSNPDLLATLMAYFATGELQLDPDDIDLTQLDRIVVYVHRQINTLNEDEFDRSCPDTVQLEPWRVIDAAAPGFLPEVLAFVQDMDTAAERENGIDHFYFVNLRGGDAMHLMHLASMAYYFTGDDMYREFLYEELIGNLDTVGVAHTAGAFSLPKYCKKYFGDQITYGPWWAFLHLLGDCNLRDEMRAAFHSEMWDKLVKSVGNVDFAIMYAGALPEEVATDREEALAFALETLPWMGGNGGALMGDPSDTQWLDDPRRSYTLTPEQVMASVPEGITAECPTEDEIAICTAEIEFMGIGLPGLGVGARDCTGSEFECPVGDDKCSEKMASDPLPLTLRPYTDFLWQRNAFEIGAGTGTEGRRQYAGSDLSEPYWNARRYGFVTEGAGQVLAWKPDGSCE